MSASHLGEEARAIGRRQRLAKAVDLGQNDVHIGGEGIDDTAHERRVQQRHVGGGDERDLGAVADRGQSGGESLQRPAPLARV